MVNCSPLLTCTGKFRWLRLASRLVFQQPAKVYQFGFFDQAVFNIQLLYAFVTTILFVFNARLREPVRDGISNQSKDDCYTFGRTSYASAERLLRNRVLEYSDINVQINRMRKDVVADLRAKGQHSVAMEMTRVGVIESQLLQQYVAALYPLEIETHGLYQALCSPALERSCASKFQCVFRGDCRSLSLELQLSAYRSALNCVEILPPAGRHFIQVRTWIARETRGVAVRVIADSSSVDAVRRDSNDVEAELKARLKAHGGMFHRRHALVLTFLVAEANPVLVRETRSTDPQLLRAV